MTEEEINALTSLSDNQLNSELESIKQYNNNVEVMRNYNGVDKVYHYNDLVELYKARTKPKALKCSMTRLNDIVDGFQAGELIIISGRTGEGKTTFAQSLILDFIDNGDVSLLLSYEVGTSDIIDRFNLPKLDLAMTDQVKSYDLVWLEKKIWEAIAKYNIKSVFVDHLHYLVDFSEINGNSSVVIGRVVRQLKQLAIKVKLPIFLICHLTKVSTEAEPTINDIRDSSFIGQEADIVMMIWRNKNDSFIGVSKNRRKGTKMAFPIMFKQDERRFVQC